MNINIDIPDEMRVYVEAQITAGAYKNIGEYFLDLVQQDQKRKAQAKLEALLLEGINSPGEEVTPEYWQNLRSTFMTPFYNSLWNHSENNCAAVISG
jgi:antitoxin ParD1/3/4